MRAACLVLLILAPSLAACGSEERADRPADRPVGGTAVEVRPESPAVRKPTRIALESLTLLRSAERRGIALLRAVAADGSAIDWLRSLAVTELAVLSSGNFSFQTVMETLACPAPRTCGTAAERRAEALALFRQWWSTQNGTPHAVACTTPVLLGFPYCPRAEQALVTDDPFDNAATSGYIPIGLFNRIDLAPDDGADCGEYRVVFARRSGQTQAKRLLINFEAVLPNPDPARGLAGCKPVAEFWRDLAMVGSPTVRAEKLARFYFGQGAVPGFAAVVHADNYSAANGTIGGQIRTNQFMDGPWVLREFSLVRTCPACRPEFVPARLPQTPFGPLFGNASAVTAHPLARAFQDWFVSQVGVLIQGGLHTFSYALPGVFTTGQSVSCGPSVQQRCTEQLVEGNYPRHLDLDFEQRIAQAILAAGGNVSANQVVARATALSCAGCHQLANDADLGAPLSSWPPSADFVHVSERNPQNGRYQLSKLLTGQGGNDPDAQLAHRAGKLAAVLALP